METFGEEKNNKNEFVERWNQLSLYYNRNSLGCTYNSNLLGCTT